MGSISFEIYLCGDVCYLIRNGGQILVGIRETVLFSDLSKLLGS